MTPIMIAAVEAAVRGAALARGYAAEDVDVGLRHWRRRERIEQAPGRFDGAGRFHAAERTPHVEVRRSPSRA